MNDDLQIFMTVRFCRSPSIVTRNIANECILVPIVRSAAEIDSIYTFNRVGAYIWEHLDGCATGAEIVLDLVRTFEVSESEAARDYQVFMAQLESIQAVIRAPARHEEKHK